MAPFYSIWLLLAGCSGTLPGAYDVDLQVAATGVVAVGTLDPADAVISRAEGLFSVDGTAIDPTVAPIRAAARFRGRVVATETELLSGDALLIPSPLANALPGPVEDLVPAGTSLWIRSVGSWWIYENDALSQPMIDGAPLTGEVVGGVLEDRPVIWARIAGGTVAIASSVSGPTIVVRSDLEPLHLAAGRQGLWAATEEGLHLFNGEAFGEILAGPIDRLVANPAADGVWMGSDEGAQHVDLDQGQVVVTPLEAPGSWEGSDVLGRLWLLDQGTLSRASAQPVVRLAGLNDGDLLEAPVNVAVDVSHLGMLQSAELRVNGSAVPLTRNDDAYTAVVDPAVLGGGMHELVASATWDDGTVVDSRPTRITTAVTGPITWIDRVEPVYRARCAVCHDNGTETILIGQDEWIANIDRILTEVRAGRMPIGSTPLDPATIAMFDAWKEAGFP